LVCVALLTALPCCCGDAGRALPCPPAPCPPVCPSPCPCLWICPLCLHHIACRPCYRREAPACCCPGLVCLPHSCVGHGLCACHSHACCCAPCCVFCCGPCHACSIMRHCEPQVQ
jgi:hypothetical protein